MGEFLGQFFSACFQFQAKCRKILTCKAIEAQRKNAILHFMWNFLSTAFMEQQQQYVVVATPVCGWNAKEKKLQNFRATAAAATGYTLVSVSRCAKFLQKLYQNCIPLYSISISWSTSPLLNLPKNLMTHSMQCILDQRNPYDACYCYCYFRSQLKLQNV